MRMSMTGLAALCGLLLPAALVQVHAQEAPGGAVTGPGSGPNSGPNSGRSQGSGWDSRALPQALAQLRARPPLPRIERSAYMLADAVQDVALSPRGRRLAWLENTRDGSRELWWQDLAGGSRHCLLDSTEASALQWTADGRWLLLQTAEQWFALAMDGQSGSGPVGRVGGREQQALFVDPAQAAVIVLRQQPETRSEAARWQLLRKRIGESGASQRLFEDADRITGFSVTPDGTLAWVSRMHAGVLELLHVDGGSAAPGAVVLRCAWADRCSLLPATDAQGNAVLRGAPASDLGGLWRLSPQGALDQLAGDDAALEDLSAVFSTPGSEQPQVAAFGSRLQALRAEDQRPLRVLQARLPGRLLHLQIPSDDGPWLVIERASDQQGVRYHLFDPQSGLLQRNVLAPAPLQRRTGMPGRWLDDHALEAKLAFDWHASDGRVLHGWLSVPPGREPTRLPLVVLVHGGPWAQSGAGYNRATQVLVQRGYAVFEPQFRGSTGYGKAYSQVPGIQFGDGRVQQDIEEGTRAVLAQGVGDAARVAVVGASFGGYSTLLALGSGSGLFSAGVAMMPPTDFAATVVGLMHSRYAQRLCHIDDCAAMLDGLSPGLRAPATLARLHAESPLANAARMDHPLLMLAGGADERVSISSVAAYASRLRLMGKDLTLYIDDSIGHTSESPLIGEANLYLLVDFLHRQLGGDVATAPDDELKAWLRRCQRPENAPGPHNGGPDG